MPLSKPTARLATEFGSRDTLDRIETLARVAKELRHDRAGLRLGPGSILDYLDRNGHERGPSRRPERASDLGGDTGNRTPDLLLANSRRNRRYVSLGICPPLVMGRRLGWRWGRCRTFLEYGPPPPQQDERALGVLAWGQGH